MELNGKKILLVRNDNIGDLICTTPAIEALRKKYPEARIDIVVNSYNHMAVDGNPFIDAIYCYTKPKHVKGTGAKIRAFLNKTKMIWQIFQNRYDAVVVLRAGYSGSATLFAKICRNAICKAGVKNPKGSDPFTHHIEPPIKMHEVEFCYRCFEPFGVQNGGEKTLFVLPEGLESRYADQAGAILFHISSRIPDNRYPKKKILEVLQGLSGHKVIITAEPQDHQLAAEIEQESEAHFLRTESFMDMAALLKWAKLFIGLDGGVIHLAPALGVPIVTIVGKTYMQRWHPWGYEKYLVQNTFKKASENPPQTVLDTITKLIN